jgi:hypothetical protein
MSRYIGATGDKPASYYYKLFRDSTGYLVFTKVDLNADSEVVVINNDQLVDEDSDQQSFDISSDIVVVNIDENHEVISPAAGHSQYKIKPEDLLYFLDDNGNLIVRINGSRDYPTIV